MPRHVLSVALVLLLIVLLCSTTTTHAQNTTTTDLATTTSVMLTSSSDNSTSTSSAAPSTSTTTELTTATDLLITTTATTTPAPPQPTIAPFTMIANQTLERAEFFGGFVSFVGGMVAMPSSPYAISRAITLLHLSHCSEEDKELMFPVSLGPFMKFGDYRGEHLRGAVVGNVAFLVIIFVLFLLVGAVKPTPSAETKYDTKFGQVLNTSRMPSYFGIFFAVFLDGTISSAVRLARVSEVDGGNDGFVAAVGFFTMIAFGVFLYYQLSVVREGPKPLAYLPCEIRSENFEYEMREKINSSIFRYTMIGHKAWVPADEARGYDVPPEALRIYHLQFHYRDLDPTEGGLNKLMPYFFFTDAFITGLISILGGIMTPCVSILWAIFVLEAIACFIIVIYKPFVVPLFNTMIGLQAACLSIAALLIQSGMGERDFGRHLGEWLALGGAAFAFTPAFIIVVRTIILWKGGAGFVRETKKVDDEEKELLAHQKLVVAERERAAAENAEREEEEKKLAAMRNRSASQIRRMSVSAAGGEGGDSMNNNSSFGGANELSLSGSFSQRPRGNSSKVALPPKDEDLLFGPSPVSSPVVAAARRQERSSIRSVNEDENELLFGPSEKKKALEAAPKPKEEIEAMFAGLLPKSRPTILEIDDSL